MTKKVELAYIAKDSSRRTAYKKRAKGLLKKVDELTTLCGVVACAIIHSVYESSPVVWPDRERAQHVVEQFRQMPEREQKRRMYDHPAYLHHRIEKATKELERLKWESRRKEVAIALHRCLAGELALNDMTKEDLTELGGLIDMNLEEINRRLQFLQQKPLQLLPPPEPEQQQPQPLQLLPPQEPEQQQQQPLQMLPLPEPEMEHGIPSGHLGPMGRLLLGKESNDVEFDKWLAGKRSQVAPGESGGASA